MGVELRYWEFEKSLQNTFVKAVCCLNKLWSSSYISKYAMKLQVNIAIILKVKLGKAVVRGTITTFLES